MDKLKPLGINKGPGVMVVLIYGVELVAGHLSQFPVTEQIENGVSNPRDMARMHLEVMQSLKKSNFPEARINEWVF